MVDPPWLVPWKIELSTTVRPLCILQSVAPNTTWDHSYCVSIWIMHHLCYIRSSMWGSIAAATISSAIQIYQIFHSDLSDPPIRSIRSAIQIQQFGFCSSRNNQIRHSDLAARVQSLPHSYSYSTVEGFADRSYYLCGSYTWAWFSQDIGQN